MMMLLHGEEDHSYSNIITIISDSTMLIDLAETFIIKLLIALFLIINGIMLLLQLIINWENYTNMYLKTDN